MRVACRLLGRMAAVCALPGLVAAPLFAHPILRPALASPKQVPAPQPPKVSFVNDVVPVLTRAGCNQGACHGAAAGKNGFKLSLRGFAPELDWDAITRQDRSRRVSPEDPLKSLILLKPLAEVPHMGGRVIQPGTPEYDILTRWLLEGAPGPDAKDPHVVKLSIVPGAQTLPVGAVLRLKVYAGFSDGSFRNVTHWARFGVNDENVAGVKPDGLALTNGEGETAITASYQDRVAFARVTVPFANATSPASYVSLPRRNYIDDLVYTKLSALHLWPSRPTTDGEFMRRLSLDLVGTLPTPERVRAFVADPDPEKRAKLVQKLMETPEFADFWTYKWCDLLRVNRGSLKDKGMWAFYAYIHDSVARNKPWDRLTREVITATGNTFLDGPSNYFRTALGPQELAENVSQAFLGIRMQCAKCHNHPLEKWTQNDYYGMANLFARVGRKVNSDVWVNDEMTVYNQSAGDVDQPRLGHPIPPRPLGGMEMAADSTQDRRVFLADWLARPDNWYFSHAIVNRVWAHFMGRGLVEPVDDLRETNPPTNPALFDALAADFVRSGYDLRHLMTQIVLSAAYGRSSEANPRNRQDDRYYSRYLVRRLTAEQLLDALCQVTGVPETFAGMPPGYRAIQLPDTHVKSEFMDSFGRPARQITCECERSQEPNMAQALLFINGDLLDKKVSADGGLVDRLVKEGKSDSAILDALYWTAFGRSPSPGEAAANLAALHKVLAPPAAATNTPPVFGAPAAATDKTAAPNTPVAAAGKAPAPNTPAPANAGAANSVPASAAVKLAAATSPSAGPAAAPDPVATLTLARRRAFEDMLWVLVNSKEFLFNH